MTWDTTYDDIEKAASFMEQHPEGVRARDIADALGVDRSTGHRRLERIRERYMVEEVEGRRGYYRLAEPISSIRLRKSEALTIYLALRRFIRQTNKAPDFMLNAIQKVIRVMGRADLRDNLLDASEDLRYHRSATVADEQIWEKLINGWHEKRLLRIHYLKPGQAEPDIHTSEVLLFEPMPFGDGVYVIIWSLERAAQSNGRDGVRQLKVDRIQRVDEMLDYFEPRGSLDINTLLRHALGVWMADENNPPEEVVLRFSPDKADRVQESVYIEDEEKTLLEDGALEWRAHVANLREIKHWVLGWGAGVEVIAPLKLRQEIADELREAAAQYR